MLVEGVSSRVMALFEEKISKRYSDYMAMDLLSELDSCGRLELLMKQMQNESVNLKGAPLL